MKNGNITRLLIWKITNESRKHATISYMNKNEIILGNTLIFFPIKCLVLIRNVSLSPNDNPLTITEGKTKNVTCSVNADAHPSPIIRWYIGDTEIGVTKETLELTADEIHDGKILCCQATNNDNSLSRSTFLNILCKFPWFVWSYVHRNGF